MTPVPSLEIGAARRGALRVARTLGPLGAALLAVWFAARAPESADADVARAVSRTYQEVSAAVAPGVVRIASFATRGGLPVPRGEGSGIVTRADGLVVTNAHVVAEADVVRVAFLDGETVVADVVGVDEESDLALLRVPREGLVALTLRTEQPPRVGEAVLAIGNPLGLGHTVTAGIVSGLGRAVGIATYEDFLQTDAAISPGNSGGPLIDLDGRVVGVNTAVADASRGGQGIGFAIPAAMVADVVGELERSGRVTRGYLGVQLALVDANGVVPRVGPGEFVGVERVHAGSPAERAGMRVGDVVLAFGDAPVDSVSGMLALVARGTPGDRVPVRVRRGEDELVLELTLAARPATLGR